MKRWTEMLYCIPIKNEVQGASEMAQEVRVLIGRPEEPEFDPRSHMIGGDNQFFQAGFWPPHKHTVTLSLFAFPTHIHIQIKK